MTQKHFRILLVDDDEDDYIVTQDLLEESQWVSVELDWVSSYQTALPVIERQEHDIYLFDYRLGAETGLELLRVAIEQGCQRPIILLTGLGDHDIDVEAIKMGAADYLVKGQINGPLLERSILHAFERKRAELKQTQLLQELEATVKALEAANQALHRLNRLDGLTQIANRRHFDEVLNQEWQAASQESAPLALVLCDVDYFKYFNDLYGHTSGDDCLKQVAKAIRHTVYRVGDLVARYGGEEFAVLLPDTTLEQAVLVGKRIQKTIFEKAIPHARSLTGHVTVSCGVASNIPNLIDDPQNLPQTLIDQADLALYAAKAEGRNCVVSYDQVQHHSLKSTPKPIQNDHDSHHGSSIKAGALNCSTNSFTYVS